MASRNSSSHSKKNDNKANVPASATPAFAATTATTTATTAATSFSNPCHKEKDKKKCPTEKTLLLKNGDQQETGKNVCKKSNEEAVANPLSRIPNTSSAAPPNEDKFRNDIPDSTEVSPDESLETDLEEEENKSQLSLSIKLETMHYRLAFGFATMAIGLAVASGLYAVYRVLTPGLIAEESQVVKMRHRDEYIPLKQLKLLAGDDHKNKPDDKKDDDSASVQPSTKQQIFPQRASGSLRGSAKENFSGSGNIPGESIELAELNPAALVIPAAQLEPAVQLDPAVQFDPAVQMGAYNYGNEARLRSRSRANADLYCSYMENKTFASLLLFLLLLIVIALIARPVTRWISELA
ncbi:hypothetical protein HELRODRAFT_176536 [Helobdella robusta]|uniref:Uncharacterized protein n=1 Tax=Helobdella robusta TaxID=6412 RepID=T1FAM7_HELRO|nr:hypothetical protein HELRODRAFT_176536 [Helobdella robusta]ESN99774.1 hypothetical protein HELRODRAFT_176536 [Helobdella robusta]